MDVKTFRAKNMQEALALVRSELGPQAAVLQTREVRTGGLLRRFTGGRQIEVTASADVHVPSRFVAQKEGIQQRPPESGPTYAEPKLDAVTNDNAPQLFDYDRPATSVPQAPERESDQAEHLRDQLSSLQSMVENLYRTQSFTHDKAADEFFDLYTTLIDVDISESSARDLVDRLPRGVETTSRADRRVVRRAV